MANKYDSNYRVYTLSGEHDAKIEQFAVALVDELEELFNLKCARDHYMRSLLVDEDLHMMAFTRFVSKVRTMLRNYYEEDQV